MVGPQAERESHPRDEQIVRANAVATVGMHRTPVARVVALSPLAGDEEQLLAGLQAKVLHPDIVEYTFRRFEEELARFLSRQSGQIAQLRRRIEEKEKEIRNCTRAIASMGLSGALQVQLIDLEAEHQELTEKLGGSEPRAIRLQLRDTRRFVEARLRSLQSMWTGEARLVRAEIAKHVAKITLTPDGRAYIASGTTARPRGDRKARGENHPHPGRKSLHRVWHVGFAWRRGC